MAYIGQKNAFCATGKFPDAACTLSGQPAATFCFNNNDLGKQRNKLLLVGKPDNF